MSENGGTADTQDLKSFGLKNREGSTPSSRIFDEIAPSSKIVHISTPCSKSNNWIRERFMLDKPCEKEGNQISNGYEAKERQLKIYFDTIISLQKTKAHFTRQGTIELSQGKSKVTVDVNELDYIVTLSRNITNRQAEQEIRQLKGKEAEIVYLKGALKKLEAQK